MPKKFCIVLPLFVTILRKSQFYSIPLIFQSPMEQIIQKVKEENIPLMKNRHIVQTH